jgi:hypothetical protein
VFTFYSTKIKKRGTTQRISAAASAWTCWPFFQQRSRIAFTMCFQVVRQTDCVKNSKPPTFYFLYFDDQTHLRKKWSTGRLETTWIATVNFVGAHLILRISLRRAWTGPDRGQTTAASTSLWQVIQWANHRSAPVTALPKDVSYARFEMFGIANFHFQWALPRQDHKLKPRWEL